MKPVGASRAGSRNSPSSWCPVALSATVPHLDLYERCQKSPRALETFLRTPPDDARARRCFERLHRIVAATLAPAFQAPTRTFLERRQLLDELRTALRVEVKAPLPPPALQPATPQAIAEDREVGVALAKGPCKNRLRKDGRRAARPARREEGEYALVLDRRATQPGGMDRRPDCAGYSCTRPEGSRGPA